RVAAFGPWSERICSRQANRSIEDCVVLVSGAKVQLNARVQLPLVLKITRIRVVFIAAARISKIQFKGKDVVVDQIGQAIVHVNYIAAELRSLAICGTDFEACFEGMSAVDPVEVV